MNIKRLKRNIDETDHRDTKLKLIDEALARVGSERESIDKQLGILEEERADLTASSITGLKYQMRRWSLWTLASILVLADAPVQYLLNRVGFPQVDLGIIALTAPIVALGIATGTHAIAHNITFDPIRPRRSVRICLTLAGILGIVAFFAGSLLLYARTATGEVVPYLVGLVGTAMWVVGETLPLIAGSLSAAAHTLSYPAILDRRIQKAKDRIGELERLTEWLNSERAKTAPPRQGTGLSRLQVQTTVAGLLLAFVMAFAPGAAKAQNPTNQDLTSGVGCTQAVDVSSSVDPINRRSAVDALLSTLPEFIRAFNCDDIRAAAFGDAGAFTPLVRFDPPKQLTEKDCSSAPLGQLGLAGFFADNVRGFEDYYHREAIKECAAEQSRKNDQYLSTLGALQEHMRVTLLPAELPPARCTAIFDFLDRVLRTGMQAVVLVTDAAESCRTNIPKMEVAPKQRVIFVLVPSKGPIRETGPEALKRAQRWKLAVSGLVVLMPSEVTTMAWRELKEGKLNP
jgi:hypothetical protein